MKVLLTGSNGQLGLAIQKYAPKSIELISTNRNNLDLADSSECTTIIKTIKPDWVLNAGAYTAVDKAESEIGLANSVNAEAPNAFAKTLKDTGGKLLQISTDFVFDGNKSSPYLPKDKRNPLGIYGLTKAKGEEAVEKYLFPINRGFILRTSWVLGPVGKNFALTMMKLHSTKDQIKVVTDQIGSPTCTASLAKACWQIIITPPEELLNFPKILHWTNAGVASWYDLAVAIGELGEIYGHFDNSANIIPISSLEYLTQAKRPSYSVLDINSSIKHLNFYPNHWRHDLTKIIKQL